MAEQPEPTETPNRWITSVAARKWIYGIAVAIGAALLTWGIATFEQIESILNIIAAVLLIGAPGLALANVPRKGG